MGESTQNLTENKPENQVPSAAEVKLRLYKMQLSGDFDFLEQQYLAKKLNRSNGAISRALNGEIPTLLARIVRHLDFLDRRRAKKLAA